MKFKIKKATLYNGAFIVVLVAVLLGMFVGVSFVSTDVNGEVTNITNETVLARVNVTNTEPNITAITVDDDDLVPAGEIDLTANNVTIVTCNATVFDYNGAGDISSVNATLYINSVRFDATPDNNYLYVNNSCGACTSLSATTAACPCRIPVQYYANASDQWICNMTVQDNGGTAVPNNQINLTDTQASSTVTVTNLLAIDTPLLLDYGNLSVTETSAEIQHNVTNVGNVDLNLTLRGYGGTNETIGQNLSMICQLGNMSVGAQRYLSGSTNIGSTNFDTMVNLTNQTLSGNLTVVHRINDANVAEDRNTTLWRLRVPLAVGGICNGTIIFGAIEASP